MAAAAVASLLASSCIGRGSTDDEATDSDTTEVSEPDDPGDASSTTAPSTTTTTDPPIADLTDVAWVVNDFDGLVDDQGNTIAAPTGVPSSDRPSVVRAGDGSIYYVLSGRLWRHEFDRPSPTEVETEADEIFGVDIDTNGNVVVNPFGDPEIVAENAAGLHSGTILGESGDFITATNGITVRVLEPDADVDDLGYITEFRSPARLEVERDGVIEWTIDAGGVRAPWLGLVDFDGRFVMMARYPTEPADPAMQHIVYDLDCPSNDAAGTGCTRTFWARWGTAALVGPDRDAEQDDLNTVLLDICPTMGAEIEPPAEMTDPESFDEDFTAEDLEEFRLAASQLSTCDPVGIGSPEQPGLLYVSGSDDPAEDGWMWTDFARSLRGPFAPGFEDTLVWAADGDGPKAVLTRDFGDAHMMLQNGRRIPHTVALTVTPEAVMVSGRTDSETAEAVISATEAVAERRGVQFSDWLDRTGAAHPADLVDRFTSAVESVLVGDAVGEIQMTADDVFGQVDDPVEPTEEESDLGFLMADFASGGEGVYPELPLAGDVLLALGPEVVARRQSGELFRRTAWAVNSADFAARVGPFNLLDLVPSPSEIVVGPHMRCGGSEAIPSPPELVTYTRITILPLPGSIDSCLDWSAVSIFVDDNGSIRGVGLNLSEP